MTLQDLQNFIEHNLPDNQAQQITPAKLRQCLILIVSAVRDGVDE